MKIYNYILILRPRNLQKLTALLNLFFPLFFFRITCIVTIIILRNPVYPSLHLLSSHRLLFPHLQLLQLFLLILLLLAFLQRKLTILFRLFQNQRTFIEIIIALLIIIIIRTNYLLLNIVQTLTPIILKINRIPHQIRKQPYSISL